MARGGACVSGYFCEGCEQDAVDDGVFDDPYIMTRGGHSFEFHIAGAKLKLESGQSTSGRARSSVDGDSIGFCDGAFANVTGFASLGPHPGAGSVAGAYVEWDYDRRQCMPKIGYLSAGTRLLPFHDLASRDDIDDLENRINATSQATLALARDYVRDNQRAVQEALGVLGLAEDRFQDALDDFGESQVAARDTFAAGVSSELATAVDAVSATLGAVAECAAQGMLYAGEDGCIAPFAAAAEGCDENSIGRTR